MAQTGGGVAYFGRPQAERQRFKRQVAEKCSFSYMKAHEEQFEMMPPNFLASGDTFFKSGSLQRHAEVDPAHKARILAFCREKLAGSGYPLAQFYPDVAQNGR